MPFPATPKVMEEELVKRLSVALWPNAAVRQRVAQQVSARYWDTYRPEVRRPGRSQWMAGPQGAAPLPPGQTTYVVALSYVGELHKHGSEPVFAPDTVGVYWDPVEETAEDVARVLNELEADS
jgi:hypothetical protein